MERPVSPPLKNGLLHERIRHNWRQQDVADQLGTTVVTVRRWEQGRQQPSAYYRIKLCALFGKNAEELGLVDRSSQPPIASEEVPEKTEDTNVCPTDVLVPWTVPYPRNPFFTGREALLRSLHERLKQEQTMGLTRSWAISGLGGIGKTQIALEYVYRYASTYTAIFWIRAETYETLLTSFIAMAEELNLPERHEHDQRRMMQAITRWLSRQSGWLLVFDNVEECELFTRFLPSSGQGSLLLTTRLQALGSIAQLIAVGPMSTEEGVLFLARRVKRLTSGMSLQSLLPPDVLAAQAIVEVMGGFPLALDQAGAYVEETGCDLDHYRRLYQTYHGTLLNRRGRSGEDHPGSVVSTLSLSLRHVEEHCPPAADLLRLCAFVSADAIPEELFLSGADPAPASSPVFDALELNEAFAVLRRYSLITRHTRTGLLSIHPLVQAVLKTQMDQRSYQHWAQQAISAVNRRFPAVAMLTTWSQCQHLLPHALACATVIQERHIISEDAGRLLHQVGAYLLEHAQYAQAETCLRRARTIRAHVLGAEHLDVAESISYEAELAYYKGQYSRAEQLHQQALSMRQQQLEPTHSAIATSLNNLAGIYWRQGAYKRAEYLYSQALQIRENALGSDHLDVAETLQNLAYLLFEQGRYGEAEPLYQRALSTCQQLLDPNHPYLITIFNNLGQLYQAQGKYAAAKALYQRARVLCDQQLDAMHPHHAMTLSNLAGLACAEGEQALAKMLYQQALQIREQALGPDHPRTAQSLHDLATLYSEQDHNAQAAQFYHRALTIREKTLGSDHPTTCRTRECYTQLCARMS